MRPVKRLLISALALTCIAPSLAFANAPETVVPSASDFNAAQMESCVTMMRGFPDDGPEARYVFFRLGQELAGNITPELAQVLASETTQRLPADTPMIQVIEDIDDPVLRQAAPERTVAAMSHMAYFDAACGPYVDGQIRALRVWKPELSDHDIAIREDALYLRQILAEALDRLGRGDEASVQAYTASLVTLRDDIEFESFEHDVDDLEVLFMGDLDNRLAKSNDLINSEMDTQSLSEAIELSDDMNEQARANAQRERMYSLIRILGGGY